MSKAPRQPPTPFRLGLWVLAAALAIGALRPDWALVPAQPLVAQMRDPSRAEPLARALLAGACAICLLLAAGWHFVLARTCGGVSAIESWSMGRFWWTVGLLALLLRAAMAVAVPYEPASDAFWYHEVAQSLARGDGLAFRGEPTAFRSPGYSLLLSLLYRLGGYRMMWAWVLGVMSTALLLFSVFSVGRQLHGVRVARVATLLAAVYPALVLMTGQTMSDLLFVAGMFGLLAFALRADGTRLRDALVVGLIAGALTLVRTVGIGLIVLVPAAWWRRGESGRFFRAVMIAAAGCFVVVAPWMARNAEVLGAFTIGTNGGSNLLAGARADATGWRDAYELPPAVEDARGEVARDAAMRREAFAFVREHPADALALLPRKFVAMYLMETEAVTSMFQGGRRGSDALKHALLVVSQLAWLAVAALVLVRLASWRFANRRPHGVQWTGWLFVAYFTAICLIFFGEDRYRLPVLPWLLIEAASVLALTPQPRSRSINPFNSSSEAN